MLIVKWLMLTYAPAVLSFMLMLLNVLVLLNGSFTELSEFLITCCSVLSATVNVFSY